MVGMVILRRVREHKRRAEASENLDEPGARRDAVDQCAIGKFATK